MARIAGVDLPNHKKVPFALTSIYGLGIRSAWEVVEKSGVDPEKKGRELTAEDVNALRKAIDGDYTVEGDLRREVSMNIKMLVDLNCYRGIRHRLKLPVRGQRSKTNARTRKGPKKTVAGKKKAPK